MNEKDVRQAVVMVGGLGTRLRPLTETRPKPLLPVMGKPCVDYVISRLAESGIEEIILACGYRHDAIVEYVGDGKRFGAEVSIAYEDEPAGTAGSIKLLEERLHGDFVVASGDVLADVDIGGMVSNHVDSGADVTMALTRVPNPTEFGIVGLDGSGHVERFKEKPRPEEVFSDLINAGIYVVSREVMKLVPSGRPYDFSKNLFPDMLSRGMVIGGHVLNGFWMDIGRPSDLLRANIAMAPPGGQALEDARLDSCDVVRSVVHGGVKAERATIFDSLILDNAVIGKGARIERSIVGSDCLIGENAVLIGAVLADSAIVGAGEIVQGPITSL